MLPSPLAALAQKSPFTILGPCCERKEDVEMSETLDRFVTAKNAEKEAREKAEGVVKRFRDAAEKLRNLNDVGFEWRDANQAIHRVEAVPRQTIRLADVPTIEQVRDAIIELRQAHSKLFGAKSALTHEERAAIGC
jgi:hypothetical protein